MPRISVIMSVFKEPIDWLQQSIDSILGQTYKDFEFIIVCDNPDYEDGKNVLNKYAKKDERIKILFNEENIGLTKSLNKALAVAQGELIARMDADDISKKERFALEVEFMEANPDIDVCHANIIYVDGKGNVTGERQLEAAKHVEQWLCWENPIAHSSVMFKRSLLQKRKLFYNEEYRSAQDYELWSFLSLEDVKFGYINVPLLEYRVSEAQVSRSGRPKQLNNAIIIRRNYIFKRLHKLGVIDSENISVEDACEALQKNDALFNNKEEVCHILYLFYYHLNRRISLNGIKYLLDRHRLLSHFGWKQSIYIILHPFFKSRWNKYNLFAE